MKLLKKLYPSREFKSLAGELCEKRVCGDDPSRGEVWTVCGQSVADLVAMKLGFDPSTRFVTVSPKGRVGFSCGKPEEISALYRACASFGLPMSKGLKNANV